MHHTCDRQLLWIYTAPRPQARMLGMGTAPATPLPPASSARPAPSPRRGGEALLRPPPPSTSSSSLSKPSESCAEWPHVARFMRLGASMSHDVLPTALGVRGAIWSSSASTSDLTEPPMRNLGWSLRASRAGRCRARTRLRRRAY